MERQGKQELLEALRLRRSVRAFTNQAVPRTLLEQALDAARWAPSAGNRQAYRFLVVESEQKRREMALVVGKAAEQVCLKTRADLRDKVAQYAKNFTHFEDAPVVVVPIFRQGVDLLAPDSCDGDKTARSAPDRGLLDAVSSVAAAVMNLMLAAHALGLGTCWMTGPLIAAEQLRKVLSVPKGWELACLVPVGYAAESPVPPKRRTVEQLVRYVE